jgi:hypothetical protein
VSARRITFQQRRTFLDSSAFLALVNPYDDHVLTAT